MTNIAIVVIIVIILTLITIIITNPNYQKKTLPRFQYSRKTVM